MRKPTKRAAAGPPVEPPGRPEKDPPTKGGSPKTPETKPPSEKENTKSYHQKMHFSRTAVEEDWGFRRPPPYSPPPVNGDMAGETPPDQTTAATEAGPKTGMKPDPTDDDRARRTPAERARCRRRKWRRRRRGEGGRAPSPAGETQARQNLKKSRSFSLQKSAGILTRNDGVGPATDGPMSNHRFTRRSDEARSRLVWTTTAQSNFKHLLYNARENAEKVCQSADSTLRRERALTWMRRDYWESLCNIWAAKRWHQTSTTMKVNRASNPEANMHTSGSVSFATHQSRLEKELKRPPTFQEVFDKTHKKKGMDQYISDRAREVAESYTQQMIEKYAREEEQPQLDPEVWVAASGAPKKGHVYGFGHNMDTSRLLSGTSSSASQTSAFTTAGAPSTSPSEMRGLIRDEISGLESRLAQTMESRLVHTIQTHMSDAVQAQLSQALS
ncbi:hypothetical protein Taro_019770 [Colocasia esculenta]|uniref:Uncharacterized protein n=1 Tax=Colocasia esculenta TaxID=4460 RepID=A0A843ULW5_COLES|nr:hypothetical protein [Colocasia esculenta]